MNFDRVKGIIFDFDGTIADSMAIWTQIGLELLKKHGISYPESIVRDITPLGAVGTAQYFINLGLKMSIEDIIEEIGKRAFYEYSHNIFFKDGAERFIREQKQKGVKLCILSASAENAIMSCIKRLGAEDCFEFIMTCDKAGLSKNDTAIYDYTLKLLGTDKSETLFFDDNLQALKTASFAGLKPVGVYDESSERDKEEIIRTADNYIHSFYELTGIKIAVLDSFTLGEDISLDALKTLGTAEIYGLTSKEEIDERISDCDVTIANKIKLNEKTLKNAKYLKLICVTATGYDNVDTEYCKKRGIALCNVKGYSTDSVALVTASTVLSLATGLFEYRDYVNSGEYTRSGCPNRLIPVFHELRGKTWGIIGYGNIGSSVAKIAKALGCRVIYSRNNSDENSYDTDYICKNSDIITIHAPLTEKTRGLINKERISLMKNGVIIVNEARGAITNERDIADAVKSGKIGGFGADVFSAEPISPEHPFYEIMNLKNVCLTPHMAWGAYEARQRCVDEIAQNIKSFIKGEKRNRIV